MTIPSQSHHQTRRFNPMHPILFGIALGALMSMSACQKTLLHKDDPRSPFDRYNQTRAQHAPPYLEDEYGRRTPNLRDRLVQSDE